MKPRTMGLLLLASTCALAEAQPGATEPVAPEASVTIDDTLLERLLDARALDAATRFVRGALLRARRAGTFGPFVGAGAALFDGEADAAVLAGLGAGAYKVPIVPGPELVKDVIRARVKARLVERVQLAAAGGQGPPVEAELQRLANEIVEGVKAEVLGQLATRPRRLERPRLVGSFEIGMWPRAAAWQSRVTVLVGIGHVAIGPTAGVVYDDSLGFSVGFLGGLELALPVQLSSSPRSHPLLLFVRGEAGTEGTDNVTFGARVMLDLI